MCTYTPEYLAAPSRTEPVQWSSLWAVPLGTVLVVLGMGLAPTTAPTLWAVTPQVTTHTQPVSAAVPRPVLQPRMVLDGAAPQAPARPQFSAADAQSSGRGPHPRLPGPEAPFAVLQSPWYAVGIVSGLLGLAGMTRSTWAMATVATPPQEDEEATTILTEATRRPEVVAPPLSSIVFGGLSVTALFGAGLAAAFGPELAVQGVLGAVALYVICSVNEYVVHRYYQHLGWNTSGLFKFLKGFLPVSRL